MKPKKTQPETPDEIQERDFFQTPNYATDIVADFLPRGVIWECAEGHGRIVARLRAHGFAVFGTDLLTGQNFLTDQPIKIFDCIVTNPPFSIKRKFFSRCLSMDEPFALLLPADYSGWMIDAVRLYGCEKIIPTRRIDYITPTGRNGGESAAQFHSLWLTRGLGLGQSETFVELTKEMKKNI